MSSGADEMREMNSDGYMEEYEAVNGRDMPGGMNVGHVCHVKIPEGISVPEGALVTKKNQNDAKARAFGRLMEYLYGSVESYRKCEKMSIMESHLGERICQEIIEKGQELVKEELGENVENRNDEEAISVVVGNMSYQARRKLCQKCSDFASCSMYRGKLGDKKCSKLFELARQEDVEANEPKEAKDDMVNNPGHYMHGSFEVIDEMVVMFGMEKTIAFCQLNAWKYRARAPYKHKFDEDMAKANRYLEMAYELQQIRQEYPEAVGYEVCALLKGRQRGRK